MTGNTKHGLGKYHGLDGDIYEGDWLNGERTGIGTYTWANGNVYEGDLPMTTTGKGTASSKQRVRSRRVILSMDNAMAKAPTSGLTALSMRAFAEDGRIGGKAPSPGLTVMSTRATVG